MKVNFRTLLNALRILGGRFAMKPSIAQVVCLPVFVKDAPSIKKRSEILLRANCFDLYDTELQISEILFLANSNLY